ncbi:hypothetical protein [Micromonospora zhanjiangensis]|uniref:Uncharacterized protein n=1 Tax=Micromonospora zhanjiangensis TaxID=1522057 RepID=A0ABV8KP52_9ACTN
MSRRRGRIWRCRQDGKYAFSNWRLARQALSRLTEPGFVYWCRQGGGYHVTREDQAEYDRRRAARLPGQVA